MIQLKSIRKNYNIIINNDNQILYSYSTPVAVIHSNGSCYQTNQKYSTTTSRHINKFLDGLENKKVNQSHIDFYTL